MVGNSNLILLYFKKASDKTRKKKHKQENLKIMPGLSSDEHVYGVSAWLTMILVIRYISSVFI